MKIVRGENGAFRVDEKRFFGRGWRRGADLSPEIVRQLRKLVS